MGLAVRRSWAVPRRRRIVALALASLLGATSAEVLQFDWLHVPKTGTSFALPLLFYKCEYLDEPFEKTYADTQGNWTLSVGGVPSTILPWVAWAANASFKNVSKCLDSHGHRAVRPAESLGHHGYGVDQVVTMLRSPNSHKASGFTHHMHSCGRLSWTKWKPTLGPNASNTCAGLEQGQSPIQPSEAEHAVMQYVHCVEGCMTSMITGRACSGASAVVPEESRKAAIARVQLAKAKLDRFAFVGLTERWSQSICLFLKLFPRESGRPYPSLVFENIRASPPSDHACGQSVKKVLERRGYRDEADEAIYAHGVELFEKTLAARAPECRGGRTALPTTLPPILP